MQLWCYFLPNVASSGSIRCQVSLLCWKEWSTLQNLRRKI